jgi:hypothetical protein
MNYQVEAKNPSRKFRGRPGRGSQWRNRYPFNGVIVSVGETPLNRVSVGETPLNRSRLEGWRAGLRLRAYTLLSRALFPKSYLGKIMLVACIGINIPLLALVLYLFLIARIDLAQARRASQALFRQRRRGRRAPIRRSARHHSPRRDHPLAGGAIRQGSPDRRLQPEGLRGALG